MLIQFGKRLISILQFQEEISTLHGDSTVNLTEPLMPIPFELIQDCWKLVYETNASS